MIVNANVSLIDYTDASINKASCSTDMVNRVKVFWKGVHLWDIAQDVEVQSSTCWRVYSNPKVPLLMFHLGGFASREEAEERAHKEAFALEKFMHDLWFLPSKKK